VSKNGIECKSDAYNERTPESELFGRGMKPFLVVEERDLEDTDHMETENDDENSGDLADKSDFLMQEMADRAGGSSQGDENDRKADDKEDGVGNNSSPDVLSFSRVLDFVERDA
jgi:hypothetical protein